MVHEREFAECVGLVEVEQSPVVAEGLREVAENVATAKRGNPAAAVDESADDGDALVVVILGDGIDQPTRHIERHVGHVAGLVSVGDEEERAFLVVPTVVPAGNDHVDLFDVVLTDVT